VQVSFIIVRVGSSACSFHEPYIILYGSWRESIMIILESREWDAKHDELVFEETLHSS